jgi:hypothetical protein
MVPPNLSYHNISILISDIDHRGHIQEAFFNMMTVVFFIVDPEASGRNHIYIYFVFRVGFEVPFEEFYQENVVSLPGYRLGRIRRQQHNLPREGLRVEFVALEEIQ